MFLVLWTTLLFVSISAPIPPFGNTKKSINDPAQVINIMKSTNFCELLSLLYGILVNETDNNNNSQAVTESHGITSLQDKTFTVVNHSLLVLNTLAVLDLDTFQVWLDFLNVSLIHQRISLPLFRRLWGKKRSRCNCVTSPILCLPISINNNLPLMTLYCIKSFFWSAIMPYWIKIIKWVD